MDGVNCCEFLLPPISVFNVLFLVRLLSVLPPSTVKLYYHYREQSTLKYWKTFHLQRINPSVFVPFHGFYHFSFFGFSSLASLYWFKLFEWIVLLHIHNINVPKGSNAYELPFLLIVFHLLSNDVRCSWSFSCFCLWCESTTLFPLN